MSANGDTPDVPQTWLEAEATCGHCDTSWDVSSKFREGSPFEIECPGCGATWSTEAKNDNQT